MEKKTATQDYCKKEAKSMTTSYRIRPSVKEIAEAKVNKKYGEDVGLSSVVEQAIMNFLGISEADIKAHNGQV